MSPVYFEDPSDCIRSKAMPWLMIHHKNYKTILFMIKDLLVKLTDYHCGPILVSVTRSILSSCRRDGTGVWSLPCGYGIRFTGNFTLHQSSSKWNIRPPNNWTLIIGIVKDWCLVNIFLTFFKIAGKEVFDNHIRIRFLKNITEWGRI